MALIVEDGTGLATAESYISVANADTYFSVRGDTVWTALTTAQKESNLRKATEYMGQIFRSRWSSIRYTAVQALDWPRASFTIDNGKTVIDSDEIPVEVTRACCEYAVRASAATLLADQDRAKISTKVGPIEVQYAEFSPQTKRYLSIESLLQPYLSGTVGQYQVVRR